MKVAPKKRINIFLEPIPYKCIGGSASMVDEQKGVYVIYINSNASREEQRNTLAHELNHIIQQ